ncbi:MAG: glycerol-3-phosphate acyltransferase [Ignavibacteriales bacterium]
MKALGVLLIAYVLGSIPSAYLTSRLLGGNDPRAVGSGSMGGVNVLRNVGFIPGLLTGLLDVAKGYAAVRVAVAATAAAGPGLGSGSGYGSGFIPALAGIAVVAGHDWMLFMRFRGGKGVATSLGAFLALLPWAVPILLAIIGVSSLVLRDAYAGTVAGYWVLAPMLWRTGLASSAVAGKAASMVLCVGVSVLITVKFAPDVAWRGRARR